jgi:guanylate kinase
MGKIIVLLGGSGSGKSTLDNFLRKQSSRVQPVTSITTRARRESDADGDYDYLSQEEFVEFARQNRMLWQSQYGEHWYGSSEQSVLDTLNSATKIGTMILVPEVFEIFTNYLQSIDKLKDVYFYYIETSDEARKSRLNRREGDEEVFLKRLDQDKKQKEDLFKIAGDKIKIIENNGDVNKFLEKALEKIKQDIPELAK